MGKHIMDKLIILSIIAILSVLSGCVGNNDVDKIDGNSIYNDDIDNNIDNIDNTIKYKEDGSGNLETFTNDDNIEEGNSQITDKNSNRNDNKNDNKNSDSWCRPEDKITIDGKEYTIKGIAEYKGENVCKGEKTYGNTIETVLFSEDRSTKCISSESYSDHSSAKAFACIKKMT